MFIHRIKLRNLLSFGPEPQELELKPLNVLIGPNGAGKSNLVEVIGLLKAVPGDLLGTVIEGGGIFEWLWRSAGKATSGELEVVVAGSDDQGPLRYRLAIAGDDNNGFRVVEERLEDAAPDGRRLHLQSNGKTARVGVLKELRAHPQRSMLSEFRHPDHPELMYMTDELPRVALFREWSFGRNHPARLPQRPDLPNRFLLEDARNLGLVLSQLTREYEAREQLVKALRAFYEGVEDYHVDIQFGTVETFLREGKTSIPATRLSDGTLRYLCLLTILCHPNPPPLVCIEEPDSWVRSRSRKTRTTRARRSGLSRHSTDARRRTRVGPRRWTPFAFRARPARNSPSGAVTHRYGPWSSKLPRR